MSIKWVNVVYQQSQQRDSAFSVLLTLAGFADEQGYCWPGIETIARLSRRHRDTVRCSLRQLERDGELVVFRRRPLGNCYLLVLGLPPGEIAARLRRKLHWSEAQIARWQEQHPMPETPPSHAECSAINAGPSAIDDGPSAINAGLLRYDPSITVIDPSGEPSLSVTSPATSPPGRETSPPSTLRLK